MKKFLLLSSSAALLFSCSPKDYQVKREIIIEAPQSIVFEQVNNHRNRDAWSPWEKMDPNMTKTYEGAESGVGSIYKWTGNDEVGTGELKIVESTPSTYIKSDLNFSEPMETHSTVEWNFTNAENGTKAEWIISGQLPGFLFWMDQDDMDEAMGKDLESGLENLKTVTELMMEESNNQSAELSAEMVTVQGATYYYIAEEVPFSSLDSDFFGNRFGEIITFLGEDANNMTGAPFSVYHTWDEEKGITKMEIAVPCNSNKTANDKVKKGQSYSGAALKCVYYGPYEGTGAAHNFLHQYAQENNLTISGSPWEAYVNDPSNTPNPADLITEIFYPVSEAH